MPDLDAKIRELLALAEAGESIPTEEAVPEGCQHIDLHKLYPVLLRLLLAMLEREAAFQECEQINCRIHTRRELLSALQRQMQAHYTYEAAVDEAERALGVKGNRGNCA